MLIKLTSAPLDVILAPKNSILLAVNYTELTIFYIYFPYGRDIDYLSLTYATNRNKILKLHYKWYKYYKQPTQPPVQWVPGLSRR